MPSSSDISTPHTSASKAGGVGYTQLDSWSFFLVTNHNGICLDSISYVKNVGSCYAEYHLFFVYYLFYLHGPGILIRNVTSLSLGGYAMV